MRTRGAVAAAAVAACAVWARPDAAHADALAPWVVPAGLGVLLVLCALLAIVEAVPLSWMLGIRYRAAIPALAVANLISLLAGLPAKILAEFASNAMLPLPRDLPGYLASYWKLIALETAVYFVVTLVLELAVIWWWRSRWSPSIPGRRIALAVLVTNLVTYSVLAPLHYVLSRPAHGLRAVTTDSAWASQPASRIVYVDAATRHLAAIDSDGRNRTVLVPLPVKDYVVSADLRLAIVLDDRGRLSAYDTAARTHAPIGELGGWSPPLHFAASPSGQRVAYLKARGSEDAHRLVLFDRATGRTTDTGHVVAGPAWELGVAWSTDADATLYVKGPAAVVRFELADAGSVRPVTRDAPGPLLIHRDYGRFDTRPRVEDRCGRRKVLLWPGLGSTLEVSDDTGETLRFRDDTGLLRLGSHLFWDAGFLPGCDEVVFADSWATYLLDTRARKLGKVTDGHSFLVLSDRFARASRFAAR